jgi:F-box-like
MLPDKFPPVVLHNILSYLENRDLVALCRTCKSFYASVIKSLYSRPWPTQVGQKLEQCLALNPGNAKYLREYHCTNIHQLAQVMSKYPLRLERLKLSSHLLGISVRDKKKFNDDFTDLVSSMHPDSFIAEIDCSDTNALDVCPLLARFHAFRNLESLTIKYWELGEVRPSKRLSNIQPVFDALSTCSQLKRINIVSNKMGDWHVQLGKRLPNLRAVRFHLALLDELPEMTESHLRQLETHKSRNVFVQVTAKSQYIQLYDAALGLDDEELVSFIEWLIYGDQYFQVEVDKKDKFVLDLRVFKPKERDKILTIVKKLSFKQSLGLQCDVSAKDSDLLYFPDPIKESNLLKYLLHPQITHLELSVKQSIHSKFIPSIIQTLENLSHIVVILCARKPILEDDEDDDEGIHDGCCEYILEPDAWCTRAIFSPALNCVDLEKSVCFNLGLKVNQKPRWRIFEQVDNRERERFSQEMLKGMENRNVEIQKELSAWFKMNLHLRSIDFRIFAGEPWQLSGI